MEPAGERPVILIVDDDRGLSRLVAKALEREGFAAAAAESGKAALAWLEERTAALMLLDLKLPDYEGKDLIERLRRKKRCPAFIIITGQGDERVAVEMMKRGAMDYLVKDVDFLQFVPAVVRRALEQLDKERRLREAEEQVRVVRGVVEQGFSAVLITSGELPNPRVVYINPSFAKATGYEPEKVIGQPLSALASLTGVQQRLKAGLPDSVPFVEEISTYEVHGAERWGEWRIGPVKDAQGRTTHWLIIFRDITERRRLEKEILEISDRERRRLGQDLHDGLCQHLTGIELMSQVLAQRLATRSRTEASQVTEIARHVRDAISQTRSLARGLSPVTLESEGLLSALAELAATTEQMFGVRCRFGSDGVVDVENLAVATHLYRIAQEAVSNAIKHGKAKELTIRLERNGERTTLTVEDDGAGFQGTVRDTKGMGLHIMHYRAAVIGGSLSIGPNAKRGTRVVCSVAAEPDF